MPGARRGRGRRPEPPVHPARGRRADPIQAREPQARNEPQARSRSPVERNEQGMDEWWDERLTRLQSLRDDVQSQNQTPLVQVAPDQLQNLLDRIEFLERKGNELERKVTLQGDLIDPLNLTVTQEVKEKIWSDKCIDLSVLLIKSYQEDDEKDKRLAGFQDEDGVISLKSVKAKKSKLNIDQWSTAFNTFISVYIQKRPEDIQGLLSYVELVRGAARDHPTTFGWRRYDGEFRSKKEADPTRPWGMVDNQLWLTVFCKPIASQGKNDDSEGKVKDNICKYFQYKSGCTHSGCKFTHKCVACGKAGHGKARCWGRNNDKKNETKGSQSEGGNKGDKDKNKNTGAIPVQSFRYGK